MVDTGEGVAVDLPDGAGQPHRVVEGPVQLGVDRGPAQAREDGAGNGVRREVGAELEEAQGGEAAGLQMVEGDVPRGGDRQLVVRRRGHLEELAALVLEQPQVLRHRHPGLRPPGRGLFQGEREVAEGVGEEVRVGVGEIVGTGAAQQLLALLPGEDVDFEGGADHAPAAVA